MYGIDLNRPIEYLHASLRYFKENEHHITRMCEDDVLLLIFDGVLRFSEDGTPYELHPGMYHIQRHDSFQEGLLPSDAPKYLYVHFRADWTDSPGALRRSGSFDIFKLMPLMEALDSLSHRENSYISRTAKFYELLTELSCPADGNSTAHAVEAYLRREYCRSISLELLCEEFHFSKNHIINLFRRTFGTTPIPYLNQLRLQEAKHRLEATSSSIEQIAMDCGFSNYSHFFRLFKRENGLSPEQWRLQKRLGVGK